MPRSLKQLSADALPIEVEPLVWEGNEATFWLGHLQVGRYHIAKMRIGYCATFSTHNRAQDIYKGDYELCKSACNADMCKHLSAQLGRPVVVKRTH